METEWLAIVWAVQTLRPYLERTRFTINYDYPALKWLMNIKEASGRLARWRLRLAEFDYEVSYIKGIKNSHGDARSRLPTTGGTQTRIDDEIPCYYVEPHSDEEADKSPLNEPVKVPHECFTSTTADVTPTAISTEEFLREQATDPFSQDILSRLEEGAVSEARCFMLGSDGLLIRKAKLDGAIQIVVLKSLRDRILHIAHFPASDGHPGGLRMFYTLRQTYY